MKRLLILCTLLCSASIYVSSQDINSKLIQKLLDKEILTQEEVDELNIEITTEEVTEVVEVQSQKKESDFKSFIRKGFNTPYLEFGGYGMLTYEYNDASEVKQDLRTRVALLWMKGKIGDHFGYLLMNDFVSSTMLEYYAEWLPTRSFNLRIGQFKVPLSLENPMSLTVIESIPNTRSIASLTGHANDVGVTNGAGRDMGIQASGSFLNVNNRDFISYAVGIFQGRGINLRDNNNTKDFAGTLSVYPLSGLQLAGGLYAGQARYAIDAETAEDHVRNRWVLSAEYKLNRFSFRTEWLHGNDAGIRREGLYGIAQWYFVPQKWSVLGKVDHFYKDKEEGSKVIDYMIGANYYFFKNSRFQVNYQYSDYTKWVGQNTANTVFAQLQVVF